MTVRLNSERIQLSWMGGTPVVFSKAHCQHGDFANVAFVHMKNPSKGVQDNDYLYIEMLGKFNTQSNLAIVKSYLTAARVNVTFADECRGGAMVTVDKIVEECAKSGLCIQPYEMDALQKDKNELHRVTCLAMAYNLDPNVWLEVFKYDMNSGRFSFYPYVSVYKAVCKILTDRNQKAA
ncbi:TPA: hypothetical protein OV554_003756 [Acinetobacter baumannii]|nr:hypothetical protein [Acinetobacter baumannii]